MTKGSWVFFEFSEEVILRGFAVFLLLIDLFGDDVEDFLLSGSQKISHGMERLTIGKGDNKQAQCGKCDVPMKWKKWNPPG